MTAIVHGHTSAVVEPTLSHKQSVEKSPEDVRLFREGRGRRGANIQSTSHAPEAPTMESKRPAYGGALVGLSSEESTSASVRHNPGPRAHSFSILDLLIFRELLATILVTVEEKTGGYNTPSSADTSHVFRPP